MKLAYFFSASIALGMTALANAGLTEYNSEPAWAAATGTYATVTFEGILSPYGFQYIGTPGSYSVGGLDFVGLDNGNVFLIGDGFYAPQSLISSQGGTVNGFTIDFAAPETSAAINFETFLGDNVYVQASNGDTAVLGSPGYVSALTFAGFADTSPFTSLSFTTDDEGLNIGPVMYGASTVPAPAALLPFAGGLLMLRRRCRS
jgi:hypothetical protein